MDELEKVEKLREKANVSYEEAKQALVSCNWDMLDAMVYLEKLGKVHGPNTSSYNTNQQSNPYVGEVVEETRKGNSFGDMLGKFFGWCGKIIKKGMDNDLVIQKNSDVPTRIPVIIFILLLFVAFWVVVPLLIIGLFFGFRYSFCGPDLKTNGVNDALNKASQKAAEFKDDFKNGYNK